MGEIAKAIKYKDNIDFKLINILILKKIIGYRITEYRIQIDDTTNWVN